MSESATDAKIRDLSRRLREEKTSHAKTRNELQLKNERTWRLVPSHYINLMGVYPPLRKLFAVLTDAAWLQDPTRGAPGEDTMRTEVTELTPTERGVLSHRKHRANVAELNRQLNQLHKDLAYRVHRMSQIIPGAEWSYDLPTSCESCGGYVAQPDTGRPRKYCMECSPARVG